MPSPSLGNFSVQDVALSLAGSVGAALAPAFGLGVVVVGSVYSWRLILRVSGLSAATSRFRSRVRVRRPRYVVVHYVAVGRSSGARYRPRFGYGRSVRSFRRFP